MAKSSDPKSGHKNKKQKQNASAASPGNIQDASGQSLPPIPPLNPQHPPQLPDDLVLQRDVTNAGTAQPNPPLFSNNITDLSSSEDFVNSDEDLSLSDKDTAQGAAHSVNLDVKKYPLTRGPKRLENSNAFISSNATSSSVKVSLRFPAESVQKSQAIPQTRVHQNDYVPPPRTYILSTYDRLSSDARFLQKLALDADVSLENFSKEDKPPESNLSPSDSSEQEDSGADDKIATTKCPPPKKLTPKAPPAGKLVAHNCLDATAPPLSDIELIFDEITQKAIGFGLMEALSPFEDCQLRIFTMCSGTESPLIALRMIQQSLEKRGEWGFDFTHLGSAEIEPFKQAFIQRNFDPCVLFKDVVDFTIHQRNPNKEEDFPRTAFGGKAKPPTDVHLLIAGSSCVDYSSLNPSKKAFGEKGESLETLKGIAAYAELYRPDMILLENVNNAPWGELQKFWYSKGYACRVISLDSRDFYLPQTRNRGYVIAINTVRDDVSLDDMEDVLDEWVRLMAWLQRRASAPYTDFILPDDDERLKLLKSARSDTVGDVNSTSWDNCRIRHRAQRARHGLGEEKPLTRWTINSDCSAHDYMDQKWLLTQGERTWDFFDILFLRFVAQRDYDLRFKHRVFDISQNTDREEDNKQWGIVGCITPDGRLFDTRRGSPLEGLELLSLQGMPINQLDLWKENSKQLQDLAGNAMSTTVIGCSIIAALIAAHRVSQRSTDSKPVNIFHTHGQTKDASSEASLHDQKPRFGKLLHREELDPTADAEGLEEVQLNIEPQHPRSLQELAASAASSRLFCRCETVSARSNSLLKHCRKCGYTCCEACSRFPTHDFGDLPTLLTHDLRTSSRVFVEQLSDALPLVLKLNFRVFPSLDDENKPVFSEHAWVSEALEQILHEDFFFQGIKADHRWRAQYESCSARLELRFVPKTTKIDAQVEDLSPLLEADNMKVTWFLWAKPSNQLQLGDPRRQFYLNPVARMSPSTKANDVLSGDWEIWQGLEEFLNVAMTGHGEKVPSWEQRLGLQREPFNKMESYTELIVEEIPQDDGSQSTLMVNGVYRLLQDCDSPSGTLHRRISPPSDQCGQMFMFLKPEPFSAAIADSVVFSEDPPHRMEHDETSVHARLKSQWRPVVNPLLSGANQEEIEDCVSLNHWKMHTTMAFDVPSHPLICTWKPFNFLTIVEGSMCTDSASTALVVEISLDKVQAMKWMNGCAIYVELTNLVSEMKPFVYALKKAIRSLPWINETQRMQVQAPETACTACAPCPPELEWLRYPDSTIRPSENVQQAVEYERMLKRRPAPVLARMHCHQGYALLDIKINIHAILHRAHGQLLQGYIRTLSEIEAASIQASWRFDAKYDADGAPARFSSLELKAVGSEYSPVTESLKLGNRLLWLSQYKLMKWMQECERAPILWSEQSLVETCLPGLGGRLEAIAELPRPVRGGVIADEVGGGKTTTTLALIKSDYDERLSTNGTAFEIDESPGLLRTNATLILVPLNIIDQWEEELRDCLPDWVRVYPPEDRPSHRRIPKSRQRATYLKIENAMDLAKVSKNMVQNVDIVLSAWDVLSDKKYWDYMSKMGVAPAVPADPGRALEEWLKEALTNMQGCIHEGGSDKSFWDSWEEAKDSAKKKYQRFKAYSHSDTAKERKTQQKEEKTTAKRKRNTKGKNHDSALSRPNMDQNEALAGWEFEDRLQSFADEKQIIPVFHIFSFRRLFVDEFTYVDGKSMLALFKLDAASRWMISGTPPVSDYDSVNTMAKLLGTMISTYDEDGGHFGFGRSAKVMQADVSDAEVFHSYQRKVSPTYKEHLYQRARDFGDLFIRKNRPNVEKGECKDAQPDQELVYMSPVERLYYESAFRAVCFKNVKMNDHSISAKMETTLDRESMISAAVRRGKNRDASLTCVISEMHRFLPEFVDKDHHLGALQSMIDEFVDFMKECLKKILLRLKLLHGYLRLHKDMQEEVLIHVKVFEEGIWDCDFGDVSVSQILARFLRHAKAAPIKPKQAMSAKPISRKNPLLREKEPAEPPLNKKETTISESVLPSKKVAQRDREMTRRIDDLNNHVQDLVSYLQRYRLTTVVKSAVEDPEFALCCSKCGYSSPLSQSTRISTLCGHVFGCAKCTESHEEDECPDFYCKAPLREIYKMSGDAFMHKPWENLPSHLKPVQGARMLHVVRLIESVPKDDYVLVFVQYDVMRDDFLRACKNAGIAVTNGTKERAKRGKYVSVVHEWKENAALHKKIPESKRVRVLLLNIASPDAAGWNLHAANHVIILSPYHGRSQEETDATMEQTIGRAYRFRQTKTVTVYKIRVVLSNEDERGSKSAVRE